MLQKIKKFFYFPVASYFRFFAKIRLRRWNPKIIVVTGSNGKTTLLHMLDAQIGDRALYSYHANSSFGVPFDVLDLHRMSLLRKEWFWLIFKAPIHAFKKSPKQEIYIVEADCDRAGEGRFLAEFLRPDVCLWVSVSKTHALGFEDSVGKKFETVEEAIAFEYGYFLEYCKGFAVIDGGSVLMKSQAERTTADVIEVSRDVLTSYRVDNDGTRFEIGGMKYFLSALLPDVSFVSILMCLKVANFLGIPFDSKFSNFKNPPGRGSIFDGVKDITIIDSSYNANPKSISATLSMFSKFEGIDKFLVIGDMLEMGNSEKTEHEKLADEIAKYKFKKIFYLGPRIKKYTVPKLKNLLGDKIFVSGSENPAEVLKILKDNIKGREIILFKGARFMEGIIENLLKNKSDIQKLPRREKIWDKRRKAFGL